MKQLEAMKARLEAREDDKCVQDEIERKLREKGERRRNVEKLRKERLKKQKEDEEKIQKLNEGKRQAELVRIIVNYLYLSLHRFIYRSAHTNNQYESPIFATNFLFTVFPRMVSALEYFPPLNSYRTFMYCEQRSQYIRPNSKKNSFRGNYSRKYGRLTHIQFNVWGRV